MLVKIYTIIDYISSNGQVSSNASGANQSNLMSVLFMPCRTNNIFFLFLIKPIFNLVHIYIYFLFYRYQSLHQLCLWHPIVKNEVIRQRILRYPVADKNSDIHKRFIDCSLHTVCVFSIHFTISRSLFYTVVDLLNMKPSSLMERESDGVIKEICVNLIIVSVQLRPIICVTSNTWACW